MLPSGIKVSSEINEDFPLPLHATDCDACMFIHLFVLSVTDSNKISPLSTLRDLQKTSSKSINVDGFSKKSTVSGDL